MLQVSSRMLRELDAQLGERHRISVNEFDVLITLDNAPDRQLRMTDLARAAMLSSGGLTRLAGRLERRGLVRRDPDPDDARAFRAVLTAAGSHALAEARITHDAIISRIVAAPLSAEEVAGLERTLGRILDGEPTSS
jgi:DNA-binding MarR family transcriptional regulator